MKSSRQKQDEKEKKNYTNRNNNNKVIIIEEASLSSLFNFLRVQESTIVKSKKQLPNALNKV